MRNQSIESDPFGLHDETLLVLYKYIKKEHLDLFFKDGLVKIGTLHEYRNENELGSVIGDREEGIQITELDSPKGRKIDLSSNTPEANYFRKHLLEPNQQNIKNVDVVMAPGAKLIACASSPDFYIYCTSAAYSDEVMSAFGCNKCIEIFNPGKFFKAISKVIRHKCVYNGCFQIKYRNKTTDHLNPHDLHPALTKVTQYSDQNEYRAIWSPNKKSISSLFVKVPKAIKYCKEYKS